MLFNVVVCGARRLAYEGRTDLPPGLEGAQAVEWEVVLVDFDKEGHWQVGTGCRHEQHTVSEVKILQTLKFTNARNRQN
jgi:hypothetical protein